jgi:MoxR-like ATPase
LSSSVWGFGIDDGRIAIAAQNEREAEDDFRFHGSLRRDLFIGFFREYPKSAFITKLILNRCPDFKWWVRRCGGAATILNPPYFELRVL